MKALKTVYVIRIPGNQAYLGKNGWTGISWARRFSTLEKAEAVIAALTKGDTSGKSLVVCTDKISPFAEVE